MASKTLLQLAVERKTLSCPKCGKPIVIQHSAILEKYERSEHVRYVPCLQAGCSGEVWLVKQPALHDRILSNETILIH